MTAEPVGSRPLDAVPVGVRFTRPALRTLRRAVAEAGPMEVCGLLFGSWRAGEATVDAARLVPNVSAHPRTRFRLAPEALLRHGEDPALLGVFHSHPGGEPEFSPDDQAGASAWPQLIHVLVLPKAGLRAATIDHGRWAPVLVRVAEPRGPAVVSSARP